MKEKFEAWACDIKFLGHPAFRLNTWNDKKMDYDDYTTALAFAAWKAAQPHKCTCEKPTAISKDVCGVCGGDLH